MSLRERRIFATRGRVVALAAACILPMWVFVGVLSFLSFDRGRETLEDSLSVAARTQMRDIEHQIGGIEATLQALATSRELDRHDYAAFQAQAEEVVGHSGGLNVVLLDASGRQIVNTLQPYGSPLPAEPPPFFSRAMETGHPILSDLFVGPVTGQYMVAVAIPVLRDGHVVNVLCLSLDSRHLTPILRQEGYPSTWVAAVLDGGGTVVARIREPEKYVGRKAAPSVLNAIRAQPHGVVDVDSLEGTPILAAFSRSDRTGWTIVIAVPRQALEAELKHSLWLSLSGATGLFLFTFLAAWLLWRSFDASERAGERSRLLLQHASDGVHILDAEGNVLEASDSFCRMLGYERAEVIGMNVLRWDAQLSQAEVVEAIRQQMDHSGTTTFETRHRRKNGHIFDVEVSGHPLQLDGRTVLYNSARDITARKQAEADLRKVNQELEQFAYVASHDLREPLRMIGSYLTLLERRYADRLDADGKDFLEFARDGAMRMDRMVLDLLAFSRIGRMGDPFARVALADIVATAVGNLQLVIEDSKAEIRIAANLPTVTGSRGELVRLIQNLVGNALKYRHPDRAPQVTIGCRHDEDSWVISVGDNGIGIAAEYFERIFAIFQRLHTRDQYDGTGIGLAICRRIVEHHGGRIWLDSTPDVGTTFYFTLPEGLVPATPPSPPAPI